MRCAVVSSLALFGVLSGCWGGADAAAPPEVAFEADAKGIRSYVGSEVVQAPQPPQVRGLQVPPDSAMARASVSVQAADPAAAAARAREVAKYVHGLWAEDPLCSAEVVDYSSAHVQGSEAAASFAVSLAANLRGVGTTLERIQRVEDCLLRFRSIADDTDLRGVRVSVGPMVASVDDLESFRAKLLDRRLEPLRAVSGLGDVPPQFDAAGVRCTSAGEVTVLQRTLGGVTLGVDFACTQS